MDLALLDVLSEKKQKTTQNTLLWDQVWKQTELFKYWINQ